MQEELRAHCTATLYCPTETYECEVVPCWTERWSITLELKKRTQGAMKWSEIQAKLPADKTPEAKAVRSKLFHQFDPNGNGYLSLAEVDRGVRDVLGLEDVYESKPAIMRAFSAAKDVAKTKAKLGDDYVERSEFRLLLLYLGKYYELYDMFEKVDSSHDKRLNKKEFKVAVGHFEKWGVKVENPDATFDTIDANKGGYILFEEFADWGLKKHLELSGDEE